MRFLDKPVLDKPVLDKPVLDKPVLDKSDVTAYSNWCCCENRWICLNVDRECILAWFGVAYWSGLVY